MFSFWGVFFLAWARLGWNFSTESREEKKKNSTNERHGIYKKKKKNVSLSIFCVCLLLLLLRTDAIILSRSVVPTAVGDIVSAGFLHLITLAWCVC